MNKNTHPTTRRPVTVVPRETALAGAAAILLEAVMRIETERALSAAKGAAA